MKMTAKSLGEVGKDGGKPGEVSIQEFTSVVLQFDARYAEVIGVRASRYEPFLLKVV